MKRRIIISLFILICILCAACSSERPLRYELEEKVQTFVYEDKEWNVPYLQIINCTDENLQEKVNDILFSAVPDIFEDFPEAWVGINGFRIKIKFQTEEYLSVLYVKSFEKGTGALRIGITVDMKTGERVFLDHFFETEEQLYEATKDYEPGPGEWGFSPIDMDVASKVFAAASINEIEYWEQKVLDKPDGYDNIIETLFSKPTFYLTPTELVITQDAVDWNDVSIPLDNGYLIH